MAKDEREKRGAREARTLREQSQNKMSDVFAESRSGTLKRIRGSVDYSTAATVTRKVVFLKSGRQDTDHVLPHILYFLRPRRRVIACLSE